MAKKVATREVLNPDMEDQEPVVSEQAAVEPGPVGELDADGLNTLTIPASVLATSGETVASGESQRGDGITIRIDNRPSVRMLTISIPLAVDPPSGFMPSHADVRMNSIQRQTLHRLFSGLHGEGFRRANGHHVDRRPQAFLWLLDEISKALQEPIQEE